MDKFDRMQQLHRIFSSRKTPISRLALSEKLECSEKTIQRGIDTLRDYVQAPVEYCKKRKGWYYADQDTDHYELPGLWLTSEEIQGLATITEIANGMDSRLLSDDISLVNRAVETLLLSRKVPPDIFKKKVRYLSKHKRHAPGKSFHQISTALLNRTRIHICYSDYAGKKTERDVSPINLVHYDENWYLDAWCHLRRELRSFMLARIVSVETLREPVQDVKAEETRRTFHQ